MTKREFKKLKIGSVVKVITPLYGYTNGDDKISTMAGLGPWVGKIECLGDGLAYISFQTSKSSWAKGPPTYLEIVGKARHKINYWPL